jgi:hypothetical protein
MHEDSADSKVFHAFSQFLADRMRERARSEGMVFPLVAVVNDTAGELVMTGVCAEAGARLPKKHRL